MKLTNFISFGAAIGMALAPIAAAQAQGAADSAGYMVVRDGKVVTVSGASSLTAGDRVVTRDAGAKLALNGCSLDVPAASSVTISSDACSSSVKSLQLARAGYQMEDTSSLSGAGWLVALLALAAVITGAIIAADGKKKPASP
ncbi:hypothetical protein [Sphingomonas sp.]|uniref:hypothetical protein n=1 Tax=Sphingomonas sp. TaxID=28214 RepID=UPI001B112D1E|nr:hypothetical protein [Sphingomonas sp.]MBO9712658.1 hypothetical protein [Sphingomonas sp.]